MEYKSPWPSQVLPTEIHAFNCAPLGDGTRRLLTLCEDCKHDLVRSPRVILEVHETPEWGSADDWWQSENPAVRRTLVPFIQDHMRQEPMRETEEYGCKYQSELLDIHERGTQNDKQHASAALFMWNERHPRSAGGQPHDHISWGG